MSEHRPGSSLSSDAAAGLRFAVVTSAFNSAVTHALGRAAVETLEAHGAESVRPVQVPGAYEIPMAAHELAASGKHAAIVCCGALIRGETPHFQVLADSVAGAIQDSVRATGVPITFGILTCDTMEQALARCGGERGNKGVDAALAAIEMARVFASIRS